MFFPLNRVPTSLEQIKNEKDQSDDQEDVDEAASGVGGDHSEKPENAEHYENCPKHDVPISQEALAESACGAPGVHLPSSR